MFLNKKGQSTAEYAIALGLVVAVAAGVLQIALKGGIRQKNKQALNYMLSAGDNITDFKNVAKQDVSLFSEDVRNTTIDAATYVDERLMNKGGEEKVRNYQKTDTTAVNIEKINED
ncbi:MAG: hypothetical protein V2A64_06205 [Candidatus Omnitrophota bacterium]